MRRGAMLLLGLLLAGCASQGKPVEPVTAAEPVYEDAVAAALVFDPAVTLRDPPLVLARDNRGIQAYAGYDSSTTTYYYLRLDDRQTGGDFDDGFERRVISYRMGVSQR